MKKTDRLNASVSSFVEKLPDLTVLDNLSYRFIGFGFIMISIMIASGAIWAYYAWGRYWGWDPVETWSLITWFVYGIYLHLRRMHGWKNIKAAVFSLVALGVLVFTLLGVGLIYFTEHSAYIN